jgi:hypothetical protein
VLSAYQDVAYGSCFAGTARAAFRDSEVVAVPDAESDVIGWLENGLERLPAGHDITPLSQLDRKLATATMIAMNAAAAAIAP